MRAEESGGYRMEQDGCEANTQYDWGKDFTQRIVDESIVMVQFKNGRNAYYLNSNMLELRRGDLVAVSSSPGHDVGAVALTGWLAQRNWRCDPSPLFALGFTPTRRLEEGLRETIAAARASGDLP